MEQIIIARIGKNPTVKYACSELVRYLKQMDTELIVEERVYGSMSLLVNNVLWVGLDGTVERSALDEIRIEVREGTGIITGSGERAVLIAVYRFLYELGCRFLRPGPGGEVIPSRSLECQALNVSVREQASYRHRSVCIEGSVGYEHVYNVIEWMPKVGMNGYFMQFHNPHLFFQRFYNDEEKKVIYSPVSQEDVEHIWERVEEEIALRGLDYHATGHGWTCEPFISKNAEDWEHYEGPLSDETVSCLAQIDGERKLWKNSPILTNLCYSNPVVRNKINDSIVKYCKEHPQVDFLHFWLADGRNNFCECEECSKMRPSDYYVRMLNELDAKLTAEGIDTKIVYLVYVDLFWEPEFEKIKNPDRFVLMFAPISRTYSYAYVDKMGGKEPELAPYVRNKLTIPRTVEENVARLSRWMKSQGCSDSFDYDYHLICDYLLDPGFYECARILHKDMANLDKLGLNGMVSCQHQRTAFPTGLPLYGMAKALWDKASAFEEVTEEYFSAAFGDKGRQVEKYMAELSRLFDPMYLRHEKPLDPEKVERNCTEVKKLVADFKRKILAGEEERNDSWRYLVYHAEYTLKFADVCIAYLGKDSSPGKREEAKKAITAYVKEMEKHMHVVFDSFRFHVLFSGYLEALFKLPE